MSETPPTDTSREQNAPLPWLASKEDLSQTLTQSWKLAGQGDILLEVSFPYHASDFRRCFSQLGVLRLPILAFLTLLSSLIIALLVLVLNIIPGNLLHGISLFIPVLIGSYMVVSLFIWMALFLTIPISGWVLSRIHRKPERLLATVRGIRFITGNKDTTLEWAQMGSLILRKGDIYFVSKSLFSDGFYLPRTAFRDGDVSGRFYAATFALWKANGNPDAISPEAHNEFAPSSPL